MRQLPTTFILSARILGIVSCLVGIAFTCSMLYGLRVKRPSLYMPYLVWTVSFFDLESRYNFEQDQISYNTHLNSFPFQMVWIVALCVFIVLVVVLVVLALTGVISDVKLDATVLWILGIASTQIPMLLFCVAYFLFIVPYRSRKMLVEGQY